MHYSHESGLNDFLNCMRRRQKMIWMFCLLGLLCGSIFAFSTSKKYESHAQLYVLLGSREISGEGTYAPVQASQDAVVASVVEMLRAPDIIYAVANELRMDSEKIARNLTTSQVGRSLIVDVAYIDTDPVHSQKVVNKIIKSYQKKQSTDSTRQLVQMREKTDQRIAELAQQAGRSAKYVEDFRAQNGLLNVQSAELLDKQIAETNAQLVRARVEQIEAEAQSSQKFIENSDSVLNANSIAVLKNSETEVMAQLAQMQTKYGSNHPRMKELQAQLYSIRVKQKLEASRIAETVKQRAEIAKLKIESLTEVLNDLDSQRRNENSNVTGLTELERHAQADRAAYENFLERTKEQIAMAGLTQPSIKIISEARMPDKAVVGAPKAMIVMLFALFGFIIGIFAALLLEQLEESAPKTTRPQTA